MNFNKQIHFSVQKQQKQHISINFGNFIDLFNSSMYLCYIYIYTCLFIYFTSFYAASMYLLVGVQLWKSTLGGVKPRSSIPEKASFGRSSLKNQVWEASTRWSLEEFIKTPLSKGGEVSKKNRKLKSTPKISWSYQKTWVSTILNKSRNSGFMYFWLFMF